MEGAAPGSSFSVSDSGWSNAMIFQDYLKNHAIKHVPNVGVENIIVSPNSGNTMDQASAPASTPQRFSCDQASGLLWQRSGHPIILVAQESKLCFGESKT